MTQVQCACNCGEMFDNVDSRGRSRRFIANHQTKILVLRRKRPYGPSPTKGTKASAETRRKLSISHMGQVPANKGMKTGKPAWNRGKKNAAAIPGYAPRH